MTSGPEETAATTRSRRSLVLLGVAIGLFVEVVAAIVWVVGFRSPGYFVTAKVDVNDIRAGVKQVLTDEVNGYGATNVAVIDCNDGQNPVAARGDKFSCDVTVNGISREVAVTFLDDSGTYEVGRPK